MTVLVLNSGSSSLKCQLFAIDGDDARSLAKATVERVGSANATSKYERADVRPPLTDEQRTKLAELLKPVRVGGAAQ